MSTPWGIPHKSGVTVESHISKVVCRPDYQTLAHIRPNAVRIHVSGVGSIWPSIGSVSLFCKAKRQYLLTCKVSRYCLLILRVPWAYLSVIMWRWRWTPAGNLYGARPSSAMWTSGGNSLRRRLQWSLTLTALKYLCINHGDQNDFSIWNHHKCLS